jgi:hypothetical protein
MTIWTELLQTRAHERYSELIARWSRIDILVVADTIVSFAPEHDPRNLDESWFGMGHLMGVLEPIASVTRAHRGTDPLGAPGVIENFRFDTHDLSRYDQIWLMGYQTGSLPVEEQSAIARFMNAGGGMFATGDHAGLGSALAGQLPRVRSMRRWSSPPPATGSERVDTTRPDASNVVVFENQSDDIPQQLRLKWYEWSHGHWTKEVYPHPLLCSSAGPITEFPDHMHEGEVVLPDTLDATLGYPGMATFDEYPRAANGERVSPEIVAWGWTTGRASPEVMQGIHVGDPDPARARWTGTIGVYDGRRAGVGRVVVHSTWHHFFDINLIGDNAVNRPQFNDPRESLWRLGFRASANGQRILAQLDQYFRNIVHWLSPGVGVFSRFDALVARVAAGHALREVLEGGGAEASAQLLGAHAWQHALRYAPPCTVMQLTNAVLEEFLPIPRPPWDPDPGPRPEEDPRVVWPLSPKQMAQAALGGAVLAFARLGSIDELEGRSVARHDGAAPPAAALRGGALAGVRQLLEDERTRSHAAAALLDRALEALPPMEAGRPAD